MTYPQVFLARWADSERIQTARMAKLWVLWRYLHNLKVFYTLNTIILQILFLSTKRFYCQKKINWRGPVMDACRKLLVRKVQRN